MDDNEMKRMKEKLNFYLEEKIKIHIRRQDRQFWNGYLISKKSEDVYLFDEDKFGNVFLFLSDIFSVDEFKGDGL